MQWASYQIRKNAGCWPHEPCYHGSVSKRAPERGEPDRYGWLYILLNRREAQQSTNRVHNYWCIMYVYSAWASYQIRKIVGCTCAGSAGNVFPTADFKGNRIIAMHVGIAIQRWWGKRYRNSRRMCNPQFCVSGKRPMQNTHTLYTNNYAHGLCFAVLPCG